MSKPLNCLTEYQTHRLREVEIIFHDYDLKSRNIFSFPSSIKMYVFYYQLDFTDLFDNFIHFPLL